MSSVNRHRGEIEAILDGKPHRLCLTLGALAELENAYGDQDLLSLAERFEKGRLSASDAIRIIACGLRGAGSDMTEDDVAAMTADGSAAGYVRIVGELLKATFSTPGSADDTPDREVAHTPGKKPQDR